MKNLLSAVVAFAAVLCSTSHAGVVVTYLGTTAASVTTNALTSGGDLVTSSAGTVPNLATFNSSFVGSISSLFDAYLVTTDANGFPPVHFAQNILGIVASNAFGDGTTPMPRDLVAEFEAATGLVTGLIGSNDRALDILGLNGANPDNLNVSGVTISGNGVYSFIAIVGVPEPSSLVICLIGVFCASISRHRGWRRKTV